MRERPVRAERRVNEPWPIGRERSNGCLRVRNDVLKRLFVATPAGTPVRIHA
jgi:lipoprotein-anchoring transpeptidase ErfK/SrfK